MAGSRRVHRALAQAARRLRLERMGERQRERVNLFQGALTYEDPRFAGYDAAVLMEVVEHVDPPRLAALERVVFGAARPGLVVVTTPNVEYNVLYEGLSGSRHADHRFEWTRAEFAAWGERVAAAYGYSVEVDGIGDATRRSGARRSWGSCADGGPRDRDRGARDGPGRARRSLRQRQVDLRGPALRAVQVVSSDFCRGLVADDQNDQAATPDAFDVLQYIVGTRLRRGLLTVVDATNVQRRPARRWSSWPASTTCWSTRSCSTYPSRSPRAQRRRGPTATSGRTSSPVSTATSRSRCAGSARRASGGCTCSRRRRDRGRRRSGRERPWNDRRDLTGPFDIVGDVHGCASELRTLLTELGWELDVRRRRPRGRRPPPEGRTALFVGDLVDRGPDTPGVLRLVMGMVAAGTALCVSGNHEAKLVRALKGANVRVPTGSRSRWPSWARRARSSGPRRWRSWTG